MEIIKKGEIPKKKKIIYQFECDNCGTVYQADKNEVNFVVIRSPFSLNKDTNSTVCPLCGEIVYSGKAMEVKDEC